MARQDLGIVLAEDGRRRSDGLLPTRVTRSDAKIHGSVGRCEQTTIGPLRSSTVAMDRSTARGFGATSPLLSTRMPRRLAKAGRSHFAIILAA